ncbi:MAG: pseudouridine synthase [Ignavibacteriaceae bacterium]|jgi:23S rRNA pseudouridine2457 synthase
MPQTALQIHSSSKKFHYIIVNKPYGVLSQFTDKEGRKTLSDITKFPKQVYPVGRLDFDSEGLLLLTDDKTLTNFLLNPRQKHEKEYYVQVEGIPGKDDLQKLSEGVIIQGEKTLPAKAKIIKEPLFPRRISPIRERRNIPAAWISLTLIEGRNRQVRKMTAYIGFPTLRLIKVRIKNISLGSLLPGLSRKLSKKEVLDLKK